MKTIATFPDKHNNIFLKQERGKQMGLEGHVIIMKSEYHGNTIFLQVS